MQLILTNKDGDNLDLLNNDNRFILSKCDALHGVDSDIITIDSPYVDGTEVQHVKSMPRSIAMTFKLIPNINDAISFFTKYVKTKQQVTLTQIDGNKTIIIKGIATIPPYTRMIAMCEINLNIYCGQPYWQDAQTMIDTIAKQLSLLNFPKDGGQYFTPTGRVFSVVNLDLEKTFTNNGDVEVGMNIKITSLASSKNPRISCSSGTQTGWWMQLNATLDANDEVEINTTRGDKYIKINGQTTYKGKPVLSYLDFNGDDWLQLEVGRNTFNISAEEGQANIYFTISYRRRYE